MLAWPTLCFVALATAIELRDGLGSPAAFVALACALVASVIDLSSPRAEFRLGKFVQILVLTMFGVAPWLHRSLSEHATQQGASLPWLVQCLPMLTAVVGAGVVLRIFRPSVVLLAALVTHACLGYAAIRAVPLPHIDVWWSQNAGLDAFLNGSNPYATSFPDLYHDPYGYALGIVRDGVVHLGYPYPPVTLLLDAPFRALFGDIRLGHIVATLLTGILIAGRRPTRITAVAAALYLIIPRQAFAIESAWMDPWVACLGVAALRALRFGPVPFGIAVGLFLAAKPSMLVVAPAFLLSGQSWRDVLKSLAVALGTAAAVLLPFRLVDSVAFDHSTWRVVAAMPTHPLSLSLPGWLMAHRGIDVGALPGFLSTWIVIAIGASRRWTGDMGMSVVIAVGLLAFFALNKFAWCNYYLTVAAFLAYSIACRDDTRPSHIAA